MTYDKASYNLSVWLEGRLLMVEGTGPWDRKTLTASRQSVSEVINSLRGQPWGVVVMLHGNSLYTPEAADCLTKIIRQEQHMGRVASAVLVEKTNYPRSLKQHIGTIYRQAGEKFAFFSQQAVAKHWVNDKIDQARLAKHS